MWVDKGYKIERSREYIDQYSRAFTLEGQLRQSQLKLAEVNSKAKEVRVVKVREEVIKYVKESNGVKCLSSPGFMRLYNSTIDTTTTN